MAQGSRIKVLGGISRTNTQERPSQRTPKRAVGVATRLQVASPAEALMAVVSQPSPACTSRTACAPKSFSADYLVYATCRWIHAYTCELALNHGLRKVVLLVGAKPLMAIAGRIQFALHRWLLLLCLVRILRQRVCQTRWRL